MNTPSKRTSSYLAAAILFSWGSLAFSGDWPTYRHDTARTGVAADSIAAPFEEAWVFASKYPPQPAWPGPARRDGWHKAENLKPRMIFDWAFHVVSAGGYVYFGSSADDKVYCLDAKTGEEKWSYFTDGPIRLAPTIAGDRVYVGSDDGTVYCLSATDGKLVWKYAAAPEDYFVPGNNRVMSVWPVRSGVLVDNGTAYFTVGLFGFEGAYVCALNAEDGKELWKREVPNMTPQGYLLCSADRLYVPTGRGEPMVLDREDGEFQYLADGAGGSFCLLTEDVFIAGPGKEGLFEAYNPGDKDQIATFEGNTMIVTEGTSYLHTDDTLTSIDRNRYLDLSEARTMLYREKKSLEQEMKSLDKDDEDDAKQIETNKKRIAEIDAEIPTYTGKLAECVLWKRDCSFPYSLVCAGEDTLVAGGGKSVAAIERKTGKTAWEGKVAGRALDLAVADGRLFVSTDKGTIHCFVEKK